MFSHRIERFRFPDPASLSHTSSTVKHTHPFFWLVIRHRHAIGTCRDTGAARQSVRGIDDPASHHPLEVGPAPDPSLAHDSRPQFKGRRRGVYMRVGEDASICVEVRLTCSCSMRHALPEGWAAG
eukprot:78715-Prymnesium_polylepis.2